MEVRRVAIVGLVPERFGVERSALEAPGLTAAISCAAIARLLLKSMWPDDPWRQLA